MVLQNAGQVFPILLLKLRENIILGRLAFEFPVIRNLHRKGYDCQNVKELKPLVVLVHVHCLNFSFCGQKHILHLTIRGDVSSKL